MPSVPVKTTTVVQPPCHLFQEKEHHVWHFLGWSQLDNNLLVILICFLYFGKVGYKLQVDFDSMWAWSILFQQQLFRHLLYSTLDLSLVPLQIVNMLPLSASGLLETCFPLNHLIVLLLHY